MTNIACFGPGWQVGFGQIASEFCARAVTLAKTIAIYSGDRSELGDRVDLRRAKRYQPGCEAAT